MAKPKRAGPAWFDLRRYDESAELDAAEWLLNLSFRGWARRGAAEFAEQIIRSDRPVLRRGDAIHIDLFEWEALRLMARDPMPQDLLNLLHGRPLRGAIDPLTVEGLYHFERKFRDDLRQRVMRCYSEGRMRGRDDHEALRRRVDHVFTPQYLGRFVRVDLSLPDDVILHDLAQFLKRDRAELAAIGGPQPYREAVRLADKKRPRLKTLSTIGLLPFLDLQGWAAEVDPAPTDYELAGLIGTEPNRMREVREYADRCMDGLALSAWLGPQARGVPSKSKRRK